MRRAILPFIALALLSALAAPGQETDQVRLNKEYVHENYTKFEYRIPMRDGEKLFTVAYVPKDTSKKYPVLMIRTPYGVGPYGVDSSLSRFRPTMHFWKAGYIFVQQDVRGCFKSEGEFLNMRPHVPDKKISHRRR